MTTPAHMIGMHPAAAPPRALLLPFPHFGSGPTQSRLIPRDGFLLGRGAVVFDEAFDDPTMSPRHAEVRFQGAQAMVHDLGSAAGTRLNGAALRAPHALVEGDVLRLGDTMLVYTDLERGPDKGQERIAAEPELTGASPSIEAVRRSVEAVAPHPRTVVVTRRDRYGQGDRRAPAPPAQRQGRPVRGRQLRWVHRGPARERAVRPRARSLHRRRRGTAGALPRRARRDAAARRGGRDPAGAAADAPARARDLAGAPGGELPRRRGGRARGRREQPRARRHGPARACSAPISTPGWRSGSSASRRCASVARTSRRSAGPCWRDSARMGGP